jgi:hypothetical protein
MLPHAGEIKIDDLVRSMMAKPGNPRLARKDCLIYA